ncbi:hypothetical protein EX30DRAFT_357590 [Ascodesmis nigricans]|uniref:UNC-45/Cro1/She4 central domain-containing protein n=1 Tax=Ascodesmis nigricans TaxID=341454 RepID=A0A4V3SJG6_9PEZI|nr:hypothetical protein EX30DRAFT_357590 [Ascodesmis nigricans]
MDITTPSDPTVDQRAESLAKESLAHFEANRNDDAARTLREALSLAPGNPVVLKALRHLQQDAATPQVLKLVHRLATRGDIAAGTEALHILQDPSVSLQTSTAIEIIELILTRLKAVPLSRAGQVVAAVLKISRGTKEHIASIMTENGAKDLLEKFGKLGEDASDQIVNVLLDSTAWKKAEGQPKCLREAFRLMMTCFAASKDDKQKSLGETAVIARSAARLLAGRPDELYSFVNQSGLQEMLLLLDINSAMDIRSHATLAVAKFIEVTPETADSMVGKFMTAWIGKGEDTHLRQAFSAAAALFPVATEFMAKLFMTDGFVEGLVPLLQARSADTELAGLELLNGACLDKMCRVAVKRNCEEYIKAVAKSKSKGQSTAAVVLAKLQQGTAGGESGKEKIIDELADVLKNLTVDGDTKAKETSIEGLAYVSLNGFVKEALINDAKFVTNLVDTVKSSSQKPTVLYGALTVISNLTAYPPSQTEEQKKISELKSYADAKGHPMKKSDPYETDEKITSRCKTFLDTSLVPALANNFKVYTPSAALLVARILLAVSQAQPHRGRIASQGGVKLALHLSTSTLPSSPSQPTEPDVDSLSDIASHALARLLVSVNPTHVFSPTLPLTSTIRPLSLLLLPRPNLLPTFESLLALTNLASLDPSSSSSPHALITRHCFPALDDLLLSPNPRIQRAATELVCNLMSSPHGVAKFADFNGDKQAKQRLSILLALMDAEDAGTRQGAAGAIAGLVDWGGEVAGVLVKVERGVERVVKVVDDDVEEVVWRGLVALRGLCGVEGVKENVRELQGVEKVRAALRRWRRRELLEVGVDVMKILM